MHRDGPTRFIPPHVLAEHHQRLFRLACHKRRNHQLLRWLTAQGLLTDRLARLRTCHAWMTYRYEPDRQRFHLIQTRSCDLPLLCPLCAIRRAARACDAYQYRVQVLLNADPRLLLSYAVLTIHNQDDLRERFDHLRTCARQLLARRQAADSARRGHRQFRYATRCCLAEVRGGAYSFEVKRGANSGLWHPHLNLLLLSPQPLDERRLRDEWRALTRDSHNVYCRTRPNDPSTFVEIFKYALKFSDLCPADTYHAFQVLAGRRLMGSFGQFRGVTVPGVEPSADESCRLLFYRYTQGAYRCFSDWLLSGASYVTGRNTEDSTSGTKTTSREEPPVT